MNRVDADGRITGILASETASGRLDQGINKVTQKYPGLGDLLNTVKQTVVKETDSNIDYEPGVEMTLELTKPLDWSGGEVELQVKPIQPEQELLRLVNRRAVSALRPKRTDRPSDVTNLMFLGSAAEITKAFEQAGWSTAEALNASSKLETFRAIVEQRGYKEAPLSTLLLDGAPPDMVFQKQNDTFAARHHLRIWRRPGKFHGQDIWVCAATHDTGIDFSQESRTFTHKIDSDIDRERAKVVNDLLFTGLVRGLSLVARELPSGLSNATGDQLETDGSMAVVAFAAVSREIATATRLPVVQPLAPGSAKRLRIAESHRGGAAPRRAIPDRRPPEFRRTRSRFSTTSPSLPARASSFEDIQWHEARDIDREKKLAGAHRLALHADSSKLGRHRAAAEHRTKNLGHHRQAASLVAPQRHQQSVERCFGVGGRDAFRIHGPALRESCRVRGNSHS